IFNDLHTFSQFQMKAGKGLEAYIMMNLTVSCPSLQNNVSMMYVQEENVPYVFFVNEKEITNSLEAVLDKKNLNTENVVDIVYQQQAVFRVRPVTRCTSSMPGHAEAVLSVSFSPDGCHLASGSGDTTVRFWDISTQTPHHVCRERQNWVLCVAWSPDGKKLASACKSGQIIIWDPETGKQIGQPLIGHKQWITSLSWEPYHRNPDCRRLASASKDCDIRIWDTILRQTSLILSSHTKAVTCIKWGGAGLLYSASEDCTIKVWRVEDGVLCRNLQCHGHWVNTLALNTDYVLRTGPFEPVGGVNPSNNKLELQQNALKRYEAVCSKGEEKLVSGSDDKVLYMWPIDKYSAEMRGHQQAVIDVKFSPDTRLIASASFDKSIKLWDGRTGKFIRSLRGNVQAVYQIAWSADSRLLVSGSADSTLKVSSLSEKPEMDLPGHADEVYAVDWSPDGLKVASGGKDKVLKLWQHYTSR
ncbi:hypothetical protein L9F63_010418, partial [Diploptera punctata]